MHNSKRIYGANQYRGITLEQCREKCEVSTCEAYEWDKKSGNGQGCWIHTSIKGLKMTDNDGGTIYMINRSVKSTDICVGNVKGELVNLLNLCLHRNR